MIEKTFKTRLGPDGRITISNLKYVPENKEEFVKEEINGALFVDIKGFLDVNGQWQLVCSWVANVEDLKIWIPDVISATREHAEFLYGPLMQLYKLKEEIQTKGITNV